ncbi:MAG: acetate--CoA ligase family protein [Promethearchaeota archaeon]
MLNKKNQIQKGSKAIHLILNPRSVAIYGANNSGASLACIQLMNIIISGYKGHVYPIHLKLDSVMGLKAYKSIAEVPEIPDLVVIVLPPRVVPQVFKECGDKGVKRLIIISGGFRELIGDRENPLTEQINRIANDYGMRFIGPNCLGVFNNWFDPQNEGKVFNIAIWEKLKRNKFSIASQSGTLSSHIFFDPENLDLGLGKSISVGNEANIDIVDCLEYYKDDDETEVIGLYIEEIKRGKKFLELAKEITPKKPIVAIYGGGSEAGNRALASHTGSLGGNSKIYDAVFKGTGIIKTNKVQEFLDLALFFSRGVFPKGNRLGIITNSGGPGTMLANNAEKKGLIVPELSESLQDKLKKVLPVTASFKNPVDVTFDMNLPYFYITLPELLMKSGEVDILVQYGVVGFQDVMDNYLKYEKIAAHADFQMQDHERSADLAKKLIQPTIENSKKYSVPIFHISPQNLNSPWSKKLRENGAMLFKLWDRPIGVIAKACKYAEFKRKHSFLT